MLRMSVKNGEYIMVGDDVKIVFLGGGGGQTRIMVDAPKEVNIARSKAIEIMAIFFGNRKIRFKAREGISGICTRLDGGVLCVLSMVL
mgnify:CR=1 FL=1